MNKLLYFIIEFASAFTLVYLMYRIFVIKNKEKKKKTTKEKEQKETKKPSKKTTKTIKVPLEKKNPVELDLFIKLNNLDEKKIDKNKVMNRLALLNAFDMALILVLTEITDSIILKALIALSMIFIILILTYKLYGLRYKKKEVAKEDVRS